MKLANKTYKLFLLSVLSIILPYQAEAQHLTTVGEGWANNSVNVTVFRKNSLVTHKGTQYTAYYDQDGYVVLGKRKSGTDNWIINPTQYKGNVNDAHNVISLMVDGDGYLHVSWDHHGHPLNYAKSTAPYSLELGDKQAMSGNNETNVTYPEFFKMPNGDLIFMFRDGQSGKGNLVMNRYTLKSKTWTQIQSNLIDGENSRNAYWQAFVDHKGVIHISWVWRETWDVSTNHDLCYARSTDGGKTWINSSNQPYKLPITASSAEYACKIPQNSELINQTSMTADSKGNPYVATYWREQGSDIPQYHVVFFDGKKWNSINLNFRKTAFSLKGGGTKSIPISRPQIVAYLKGKQVNLYLLFRDEERGSKVSIAKCSDVNNNKWIIEDLTTFPVGAWEPTYDTELWKDKKQLNIFVQKAVQIDGEGKADVAPEKVQILEFTRF